MVNSNKKMIIQQKNTLNKVRKNGTHVKIGVRVDVQVWDTTPDTDLAQERKY
jgi:hypothetical protein